MLRFLFVAMLIAFSSALNLGVNVNRRAALAKLAAAAPLAALAQQASAARVSNAALQADWMGQAASNQVLGSGKAIKPGYEAGTVDKGARARIDPASLAAPLLPTSLRQGSLSLADHASPPYSVAFAAVGRQSEIDPEWGSAFSKNAKAASAGDAARGTGVTGGALPRNEAAMARLMK